MIKSPFAYPGSKSRLLNKILEHLFGAVLVEPFFGGGSVTLNASFPQYIVNDLDVGIYDFWRIVFEAGIDEFLDLLDRIESAVPTNSLLREIKSKTDGLSTFLTNRWSYGGILNRSSRLAVAKDREGEMIRRYKPFIYTQRLRTIRQQFCYPKKVQIYNRDFADVPVPEEAFIYADPPYVAEGDQLYRLEKFDHRRFIEWIKAQSVPWLVSYDGCDLVRELFTGYQIIEWTEKSRVTDNGSFSKSELLIFSRKVKPRDVLPFL